MCTNWRTQMTLQLKYRELYICNYVYMNIVFYSSHLYKFQRFHVSFKTDDQISYFPLCVTLSQMLFSVSWENLHLPSSSIRNMENMKFQCILKISYIKRVKYIFFSYSAKYKLFKKQRHYFKSIYILLKAERIEIIYNLLHEIFIY